MRNPNSPRFFSHTSFDEFREAMGWREDRPRWSEPDIVDLVVAAEEVGGWFADRRPYKRGHHGEAWEGAIKDFRAAVDRLGTHLRATLEPQLGTVLSAFQGFPGNAKEPQREKPQAALTTLQERWTDPNVLEAAWLDLLEACQDPAHSYDGVTAHRDLFWHLARLNDRSPESLSNLLSGVLDDSARNVASAQVVLGDVCPPENGQWPDFDQPSGLSEREILDLCRRLLLLPPASAHHVVWVAYEDARAPMMAADTSSITFYEGAWVRGRMESADPILLKDLPSELTDRLSGARHDYFPEGNKIVLARVDLGEGTFIDAPGLARDRAHALVGLARFRVNSSHWRPLESYLHAVNGYITAISAFRSMGSRNARLHFDSVGQELIKLTVGLGAKLTLIDKELNETVAAMHWWQEAQEQQPLSALILNVRVLELTATRVSTLTWHTYLDTYFSAAWIRSCVYDTLFRVIGDAVYDENAVLPAHHEELDALQRKIFSPDSNGMIGFDDAEALLALPRLVTLYPVHSRVGRSIRQLADRLTSPASLADWCAELENRWVTARARLHRSRNAIAHGGPVTSEAITTIDRFCRLLSAWSLSLALDGAQSDRTVAEAHTEFLEDAKAWLCGLRTAKDIHQALFPN